MSIFTKSNRSQASVVNTGDTPNVSSDSSSAIQSYSERNSAVLDWSRTGHHPDAARSQPEQRPSNLHSKIQKLLNISRDNPNQSKSERHIDKYPARSTSVTKKRQSSRYPRERRERENSSPIRWPQSSTGRSVRDSQVEVDPWQGKFTSKGYTSRSGSAQDQQSTLVQRVNSDESYSSPGSEPPSGQQRSVQYQSYQPQQMPSSHSNYQEFQQRTSSQISATAASQLQRPSASIDRNTIQQQTLVQKQADALMEKQQDQQHLQVPDTSKNSQGIQYQQGEGSKWHQPPAAQNSVIHVDSNKEVRPTPPLKDVPIAQQQYQYMQGQNQLPKSGMTTFGAQVVAESSQSQPYLGMQVHSQHQQSISHDISNMQSETPPPGGGLSNEINDENNNARLQQQLRENEANFTKYCMDVEFRIHQLEDTIALQGLSLSRTSLDDDGYIVRFTKMEANVSQLSRDICLYWRSIPDFLKNVVKDEVLYSENRKSKIAVGRAFISKWLLDNLFQKYFHPNLDQEVSKKLKKIQVDVFKRALVSHSSKERDEFLSRLLKWRLATIDMLQYELQSPEGNDNCESLKESLRNDLVVSLRNQGGVELSTQSQMNSVHMVIEVAVSILDHLPKESRELIIELFMPGDDLVPDMMKSMSEEIAHSFDSSSGYEAENARHKNTSSNKDSSSNLSVIDSVSKRTSSVGQSGQGGKDDMKLLKSIGTGLKTLSQHHTRKSGLQQGQQVPGSSSSSREYQNPAKVRMAVGFAVAISGNRALVKAPVVPTQPSSVLELI